MSGEQNRRPDLEEQIRELRQSVYELDRRIENQDDIGSRLRDLLDVRVDSLIDLSIDLVDGSALTYRAADQMWIPGGSANPSGLAYLRANEDGSGTGIANATTHTLSFAVVGGDTDGTDISIDSGVPTFNADGVYGIMLWVGATSDAAADTFNWVQLSLAVDRAGAGPRHGPFLAHGFAPAVDVANKHYGEATFSPTLFMPAGSSLEVKAKMAGGGAGTWSVFVGAMHVDRLV